MFLHKLGLDRLKEVIHLSSTGLSEGKFGPNEIAHNIKDFEELKVHIDTSITHMRNTNNAASNAHALSLKYDEFQTFHQYFLTYYNILAQNSGHVTDVINQLKHLKELREQNKMDEFEQQVLMTIQKLHLFADDVHNLHQISQFLAKEYSFIKKHPEYQQVKPILDGEESELQNFEKNFESWVPDVEAQKDTSQGIPA